MSSAGAELSAADVIGIIKACRGAGVASINFRGMTMYFQNQDMAAAANLEAALGRPHARGPLSKDWPEDEEVEAYVSPEMAEEIRLNSMMVNDPLAYEQEMIDAQMERGN